MNVTPRYVVLLPTDVHKIWGLKENAKVLSLGSGNLENRKINNFVKQKNNNNKKLINRQGQNKNSIILISSPYCTILSNH